MFVLRSTYEKLFIEKRCLDLTLLNLEKLYSNVCCDLAREKSELREAKSYIASLYFGLQKKNLPTTQSFTQEEVKKLLILCHPDKNNQSKLSVEMTQKILKLTG